MRLPQGEVPRSATDLDGAALPDPCILLYTMTTTTHATVLPRENVGELCARFSISRQAFFTRNPTLDILYLNDGTPTAQLAEGQVVKVYEDDLAIYNSERGVSVYAETGTDADKKEEPPTPWGMYALFTALGAVLGGAAIWYVDDAKKREAEAKARAGWDKTKTVSKGAWQGAKDAYGSRAA